MILLNAIYCKKCFSVLVSKHGHDYVMCTCKSVAVDGGKNYLRRVGDRSDYVELAILQDTTEKSQ